MSIKIMQIGDLHLGCRMYGLVQREQDFYDALDRLLEIAKSEAVNAVVITGDTFDSPKPPAHAVFKLQDFVKSLKANGIEVMAIEGNHDKTLDDYWIKICGITTLDNMSTLSVGGTNIIGFNYDKPEEVLKKLEVLSTAVDESKTSKPHIVVLHCGLEEMGAGFNPDFSAHQLAPVLKKLGCVYCALGHIHISNEIDVDGVKFAQSGSLELKSIDEPQTKSVRIVEFDADKIVKSQCVDYPTRAVSFYNIDTDDDLDTLEQSDINKYKDVLNVIYASSDVRDGVSRISKWSKQHELMVRIVPVSGKTSKVVEYDRSKSINLLEHAVESYFDKDSDEYKLVMEILETNNPRIAVENFMNK